MLMVGWRRLFLRLLAVLLPVSIAHSAEKYRTWVDDSGQVHVEAVDAQAGVSAPEGKAPPLNQDPVPGDSPERGKKDNPYDLTNINPDDFVDADERLRQIRESNNADKAYYTWIDAEGNRHVTEYLRHEQRSVRTEPFLPGQQESRALSFYNEVTREASAQIKLNPEALRVMGVTDTSTVLDQFAVRCCEALKTDFHSVLEMDEPRFLEVTGDSPSHVFDTGKSRYELIQLPGYQKSYYLRIRTFVHDSVMIPALVFLDGDFRPTRLIYDISMDFHPETWARWGYFEGLLKIDPMKSEKYLVVFTFRDYLERQSTIVDRRGHPETIPHADTGKFEVLLSRQ